MTCSAKTLARLLVLALPVAFVTLVGCSSSSGSGANGSCAIPDGQYMMTTTASGGSDCLGGTSSFSWPPTAPGSDGGAPVTETCSAATTSDGSCHVSCDIPGPGNETFTLTYTLTSGGFSGTATNGPVAGDDGGTYTCTYTVSATKS
jgi:hypothetical protein